MLTNKLEANIATRFDKYDDDSSNVGSRNSLMASFAYRPNDDLLIRFSASESFRAPDMNYLFQKASSGYYNGFQDYVACYAYTLANPAVYNYQDYTECEVGSGSVQALLSGNTTLNLYSGSAYIIISKSVISGNIVILSDLTPNGLEKQSVRIHLLCIGSS